MTSSNAKLTQHQAKTIRLSDELAASLAAHADWLGAMKDAMQRATFKEEPMRIMRDLAAHVGDRVEVERLLAEAVEHCLRKLLAGVADAIPNMKQNGDSTDGPHST